MKWLPVSLLHFMAGVTASQLYLAQRANEGVCVRGGGGEHLKTFKQRGWELGEGRRKPPPQSTWKVAHFQPLRGTKLSEKCVVPTSLGSYRRFCMELVLFPPQSEASSQHILRNHFSRGPSKTVTLLTSVWRRWTCGMWKQDGESPILWSLFCLLENFLSFHFSIFR